MTKRWMMGCAAVVVLVATVTATPLSAGGAGATRNGKIAFFRGAFAKGIEVMNPDGSGLRLLAPLATGPCAAPPPPGYCTMRDPVWSPDGRRLAYLRGRGGIGSGDLALYVIDASGNDERLLPGCGKPWGRCDDLVWSPDGRRIAVVRGGSINIVDPTGAGSVRPLVKGDPDARVAWSPDGSRILFSRESPYGASLYTVNVDSRRLGRIAGTGGATSPAWSPDGRTIGFFVGTDKILAVRADGTRPPRLLYASPGRIEGTWSPDRTQIVFEHERRLDAGGDHWATSIWVIGVNGTRRRRIYHDGCCIAAFEWSPDGTRVAIASDSAGLLVVNADGTGLRKLAAAAGADFLGVPQLAWQPVR